MKEKPVKLRLVEVKNGNYKLKYPNLSVPVEMNEHLFQKFLKSKDYYIEGWPVRSHTSTPEKEKIINSSIRKVAAKKV
ncbi:hypothetical protein [Abyssalbus ytuae]|uniref:Uncharacterized protein n=1 Tax=Abyssalbus ytuae TaxID=2926907 RepID=A0A9E6ZNL9_9FLAO|nr:hypothetical protein [Abyssalbus ytuae]UOB19202.1 hypothetical protein MQE35_07855 [Abyssalbus ytuae]